MAEPRATEPHPVADSCAADHCHWHGTDEPAEGAYRVCFECSHAYRTAQDLLAAHNAAMAEMAKASRSFPPTWEHIPETDAGQVFSCPFCIHDW